MDILNFLFLRKHDLVRSEASNASTDLLVLGAQVAQSKRDDQYQTYGLPLANAVVSADKANTEFYILDLNTTFIAEVSTQKGVIELTTLFLAPPPLPGFATSLPITIVNPDVDFSDTDRVYIQTSLYYSPAVDDNFVPYLITTGVATGINLTLYNASPLPAGAGQGEGELYIYFELYNF